MSRYINSPGVQIREVDLSLRVNTPTGVGVLTMGYTQQGPTDEVVQITSIEEYESLYGKPTTAAERYAYHNVKALFSSPANVYFSRLPYGSDSGNIFANEKYSALVYPVLPDDSSTSYASITANGLSAQAADTFYLQKPYHLELTRDEYESLVNDETEWVNEFGKSVDYTDVANIKNAGLVVLNTSKTTINEAFEGYYLGISDNRNTDPASPYRDIVRVNSINNSVSGDTYVEVPSSRLDFELSAANNNADSVSEVMESIPSFNLGSDEFDDMLSIGIFKLRKTPFNKDEIALSYILSESYVGSFDNDRELQNPTGGNNVSVFLENVDSDSLNVRFFVNPYLQDTFSLSLTGNSYPQKKVRTLDDTSIQSVSFSADLSEDDYTNELFPIGVYQSSRGSDKTIGNVNAKIERVFDLVENVDLFTLDIITESGLGTIFCSTQELSSGTYDDKTAWPSLSGLREQTAGSLADSRTVDNYTTIFNTFNNFCENRRKDCIFIADPIRHIFITGENSRVLNQTELIDGNRVAKTFSRYIYWPLRNQFRAANTSYSTAYAQWAKVFDNTSNRQVWVPFSGYAATIMANTDNVWDAPAGLNRGIINLINDIALYPKQKERDQLYNLSLNPVMFSPTDGFVVWGQKTLQKKPSAFDRLNVRRVFLFLERATLNTARYFVFENNNLFTRTQLVNVLTPLFENVKNNLGINNYIIISNQDNNTAEIIENNELKVDIFIKPSKSAEFILVDFHATRQDANFEELI